MTVKTHNFDYTLEYKFSYSSMVRICKILLKGRYTYKFALKDGGKAYNSVLLDKVMLSQNNTNTYSTCKQGKRYA